MTSQEIEEKMIALSNERDQAIQDYRKELLSLEKKRLAAIEKEGDK